MKPYRKRTAIFSHAMAIEPLCMLRYENLQGSKRNRCNSRPSCTSRQRAVGRVFLRLDGTLQITRNNGKGALYELHRFAEHFLSPNGFHLNGDYKNSGVCDFHYRPFTLEADFLAAHAVQKNAVAFRKESYRGFTGLPAGLEK